MQGLPPTARGMRIGLLGGSFDPPHAGHVHVTLEALKRFGLDRVWWLVSPGNPLKSRGPAALAARLAACRALMRHPRVVVTDVESRLGTRYTAETLAALLPRHPGVRFVWLMGADNLVGFHRWERWREIAARVPIGVLARPGAQPAAGLSPAARTLARHRLRSVNARALADTPPPAWAMPPGPTRALSSTALRAAGRWPGGACPAPAGAP